MKVKYNWGKEYQRAPLYITATEKTSKVARSYKSEFAS